MPDAVAEFEAAGLPERSRGFDFSGYKRPASPPRPADAGGRRRAFAAYIDYLEAHPEEFTHLFNTILINVTAFFRDPRLGVLRDEILPALIGASDASGPIRVWSAGCSSGEEAYSLAMLLAEALGIEVPRRVKIYGTDVDEEALPRPGTASTRRGVEDVPARAAGEVLRPAGRPLHLPQGPAAPVIFGRHDLIQDAPISRIDLLPCRNS